MKTIHAMAKFINWPIWDYLTKWLVYDFGILRTAGIAYVGISLGYLNRPDIPTFLSSWGIPNIYYASLFMFVGGGAFAKGRFFQPFASVKAIIAFIPLFSHAVFRSLQIYETGGIVDAGFLYIAFCILLIQVAIIVYRQDMPDIEGRLDLYLSDLFRETQDQKKVVIEDVIPRTDE